MGNGLVVSTLNTTVRGQIDVSEIQGSRFAAGLRLMKSLHWRHNEPDDISNHQPHGCLLHRLFRRKSKKTSKVRVTGLCEGNSPVTGEFPAQRASNAENVPFDDVIMNSLKVGIYPAVSTRINVLISPPYKMICVCVYEDAVQNLSMAK